jgi:hypothetical protein
MYGGSKLQHSTRRESGASNVFIPPCIAFHLLNLISRASFLQLDSMPTSCQYACSLTRSQLGSQQDTCRDVTWNEPASSRLQVT